MPALAPVPQAEIRAKLLVRETIVNYLATIILLKNFFAKQLS